jgi:vancomycin resistance protein VanW
VRGIFLQHIYKKPLNRTKLRIYLGKIYYITRRYLEWYFGNKKYARTINNSRLAYPAFVHKTPLIRKLQNVDIQLQYNKINNLKIAVNKINGIVIKPGQTFSYWRLIGKPTNKKGYLDGLALNPDGSFRAEVGGGLCQLSNLIYWMTLHTQLTVIERYRHSHDVFPDENRTQPFGSGATCAYNYLDLQIYNETNMEYKLIVYLTEDSLVGEWRTDKPLLYHYEVYEKNHYIDCTFWGGYVRNNTIYRRVYNINNELVSDEFITENHAIMMYQLKEQNL